MTEGEIKTRIMDYCDSHDIFYISHNPVRPIGKSGSAFFGKVRPSQRGAPDLIIRLPSTGETVMVEVKTHFGRQSRDQIKWQEKCERHGYKYIVVSSLEGLIVRL